MKDIAMSPDNMCIVPMETWEGVRRVPLSRSSTRRLRLRLSLFYRNRSQLPSSSPKSWRTQATRSARWGICTLRSWRATIRKGTCFGTLQDLVAYAPQLLLMFTPHLAPLCTILIPSSAHAAAAGNNKRPISSPHRVTSRLAGHNTYTRLDATLGCRCVKPMHCVSFVALRWAALGWQ